MVIITKGFTLFLHLVLLSFFYLYLVSFRESVSGFTVDLIHRDSPLSPFYDSSNTPYERLRNAVHRSSSRASLFKKTCVSPIQSTLTASDGEYLMKISIGTPPVDAFVILDTGSDLTWIQCEPCVECFKQLRPIFNPKNSSSYKTISCNTKLCQQVWSPTPCNNNTCNYKVTYADGSATLGDLSVETFRFSSTSGKHVSIPKIAFGCGHNNSGFSNTTSGLIGLAGGDVSIVNQIHQEIKGKFSYCLIPMELLSIDSNATSHISFGDNAVVSGPGVISTPLIPGQSLYYLTLESISIGNKILPFKSSKISSNTQGKILIDSGTLLRYFPHEFYAKLEKTLVASINATRKHDTSGFFNLCYASKNDIINAPKIVAHFANADVELSPANVFTQLDEGLICLTIVPDEAMAIFGNLAQANFLIGYDLVAKQVSFLPKDCTKH
ncbi:hypothetical protein T459_03819 [Capsicum annuum]|uniref:Peptidase A1 domain-containing protein n=1 Tax=Capsicum annuum TaxID=4072 RepID=A0A2G3ANX7_CAPAN|nr:aspartic proteinase CDR1-like [Capsicum annuum]PHT95937.1 hypothetical protein T459_03819 [Capsicum annuum]